MNAGMAAGGTGAVVRQGHLRKLKTMKKKYFVLRAETADSSARLEYYESEKKFKSGAAPRRALPLKSCYNITRRLDLKQKHVIALFTREEQFCVVAENEQDLHAWLSAILKQHRADDASEELLHPIQHVWQVNVQKRGLGAAKNIQGLYNLCLTDKTLTLVKIKSHNNIIRDLGIPDRVEYSLKNIRRCGDSECFFYMEVGRQTVTGSGELWMHSDDSNIAQSMHSTIYHAMRNCAKESENDRDHIVLPSRTSTDGAGVLPARRQTYSDGRGRAGLCNDATTFRNRCDSMPSRANCSLDSERPPPHTELIEGLSMGLMGHDETDLAGEWHCTPRIPEEPDYCEMTPRDLVNTSIRSNSVQHSRTSSLAVEELSPEGASAPVAPDGYLPMAPAHDTLGGLVSASSGSVCSGTPSTDPRFSEYQLAPATSHIVDEEERPPRAYSVGSRPTAVRPDSSRHRAYSVGARNRPPPPPASASRHAHTRASSSAPLLPRASAEDLMELDFSSNSPAARMAVARTPPAALNFDEYVDMSPRVEAGYVEMRPGEGIPSAQTHDGYVEMSYSRRDRIPTRPIAINRPPGVVPAPPPPAAASPPETQNARECRTPLGSQTIFPLSLESPASHEEDAEDTPVALTTVRESEEYVSLSGGGALNYAALDLAPRTASAAPATRSYTQIDFARSEKLHAADN